MEVLQARDWKQWIDERKEVEQTIQKILSVYGA